MIEGDIMDAINTCLHCGSTADYGILQDKNFNNHIIQCSNIDCQALILADSMSEVIYRWNRNSVDDFSNTKRDKIYDSLCKVSRRIDLIIASIQ